MLTETEVLYSISLIKKNPELLAQVYIEQMSEIALTTMILLMQNLAFVKHQLGLSKDNPEQNLFKLLIRCQKLFNA